MQVALAPEPQTPARVLRKGVEHVVEESNASVNVNVLALGELGGMALSISVGRILRELQCTTVQVQAELNLGLVGVAVEGRTSYSVGHCEFCVWTEKVWRMQRQ